MFTLPDKIGLGLKADHYDFYIDNPGQIDWVEVHPENYMGDGGAPHHYLERIRENHALSMHGVGMSLGTASGVTASHLAKLKKLIDRYQPQQVSEHLSWSHWNQHYSNDLLPLPYNDEALRIICENITHVQETLGRTILIENPSTCLQFDDNAYSETEFLTRVQKQTGCGLLLDINNIYVTCTNHNLDALEYLNAIPIDAVGEIHLAGHKVVNLDDEKIVCIDDHGSKVTDNVWALFETFCARAQKAFPTLIEWDTDIPNIEVLLAEADKAQAIINKTITTSQYGT